MKRFLLVMAIVTAVLFGGYSIQEGIVQDDKLAVGKGAVRDDDDTIEWYSYDGKYII
ncbi:hypothetical protein EDD65_1063 [Keratinibaculum paraultunense]|uniref:Uncharacterized protein n=1 Tax=Keratinibaculum paraultunense TaxID=1278232 RepID=A0A4V2UU61_9FIRM|nr:hypothetical protein [Keratinibaculum paraultunense]QQY79208.1 hypothetical protein JL105_08415 [Keratinibaculum paraultunense]TCS89337.1 hypothetical protein EDD65_1063 [Keratinibaculum paraultunense]